MSKLIKIFSENPNEKSINQVVEVLKKGGLIIYPSDTVYGLGCDITNTKAMENLAKLKGIKLEKSHFSIVCNNLSHLSQFSRPISTSHFKLLKRTLPGPFTFILNASSNLPNSYKNKKTIGIRVPNHKITQLLVEKLGNPIASTSIHDEDEIIEYTTNPELIAEKYEKFVDLIIDNGFGGNVASTVVDLTSDEPEIIREGKGNLKDFM